MKEINLTQNKVALIDDKDFESVSKFKWRFMKNKWVAYIKVDKIRKHLGYFLNKEDAAKAYDKKASEIFGEYAVFNFMQRRMP